MKLKSKFQIGVCSAVALAMCDVLAAKEPLYEGLGSYSRKITTDSPEAQRYFDQGLAFLHGFNHRAAIRAFQQAAEIDPRCAMAYARYERDQVVNCEACPRRRWPAADSAMPPLRECKDGSPADGSD